MMGCSAEAVCKRGKEGQVSGYSAGGEIVEASLLDIVQTAFPKRLFFCGERILISTRASSRKLYSHIPGVP